MTRLTTETKNHLLLHHGDFEGFAQAMIATHERRFDKIFWACITQYLPNYPKTIVDLGTGPGMLLNDLREVFPQSKLIGVEAQPVMLDHAKQILTKSKLENYELINHDLSLPNIKEIKGQSVDLCICSMLLHELLVPTVLIDEMKRILSPNGIIILYDWHRHNLSQYSPDTRPNTLEEFTHFSEHCRYSSEDFQYLFEKSGFKIIESMVRKQGKHILMAITK